MRQLQHMPEQGLAVQEEGVRSLLAVLQRLPWKEPLFEGVDHQPLQEADLRGTELRHRAGEHARLVLVRNGAIKDLHERLLGDVATEQQLVDVRRPHLENHARILQRLHSPRRPWDQELPVDGGIEAPQHLRRGGAGALADPLDEAEASREASPRLLGSGGPCGLTIAQLHECERVFAHELEPPRHCVGQRRGILAQGPALCLHAPSHLAGLTGEDRGLEIHTEQARQEVLVVEDAGLQHNAPSRATSQHEGIHPSGEERHWPDKLLEILQVQAAEAGLHQCVAFEPQQVVHEELVPNRYELFVRQARRDDPQRFSSVERHVLVLVEPGVHLRVHYLDGRHGIEEPEVRTLDHLAKAHALHGQIAHRRDVGPFLRLRIPAFAAAVLVDGI
mmetsp:Transcript_7259/g.15717  ORF Transcript_7259/g.15717 Transcript_7259/m.15717 type:complete len:390 (-) Transcript_7259:218-1387(-)